MKRAERMALSVAGGVVLAGAALWTSNRHLRGGAVHEKITRRAIEQLYRVDAEGARWYARHMTPLARGMAWADRGYMPLFHFYRPDNGRGVVPGMSAYRLAYRYGRLAVEALRKGEEERAVFYLGAAIHLVQDATIPQHAQARILGGHSQYERFVRVRYAWTSCKHDALVGLAAQSPENALRENAERALHAFDECGQCAQGREMGYTCVAQRMLPIAERSTAQCLLWFDQMRKALAARR